ncbi:MAG: hypothetical protein RIC81_00130 [Microcella pacifica]
MPRALASARWAASRAAAGVSAAHAASAARRHCSSVACASVSPTAGIARAAIDRLDAPRPTSTGARRASAAPSPHTLRGVPVRAAAAPTSEIMRSTAGCHASVSSASSPDCRSAAIVYWARSFVPTETKSASAHSSSATMTAAGVSIMMPTVASPAARARRTNSRASPTVAIMGDMTWGCSAVRSAAIAIARSWSSSTPGSRRAVR